MRRESFSGISLDSLDRCTYTAYGYYMNTNTKTITAEIILTGIEGSTWIFVNGEHIGTEAAGTTMVTRVDKVLRAAHVYRQTGFVAEAGALIAEGTKVVAA